VTRPVVGVLGQRVPAATAAEIGYGTRELDSYTSACVDALLEAGLVPLGLASVGELDAGRCCDLVHGLVIDSGGRCGETTGAGDRFQRDVLREALRRGRPVLSICRAFAVLAAEPLALRGAELTDLFGESFGVDVAHPDPGFGENLAVVGADRPVLAVQWHPEAAARGDPAREAPFRWLRERTKQN
jgi:gamma-glutamyl-gamma-aminobutyrate hydrolase PuuD